MSLTHWARCAGIAVCLAVTLSACGTQPPDQQSPSTPTLAASTDILVPTAQMAALEEPLQGRVADIPNVFVVAARQSKLSLASFLKTTPDQLDWVNPGLPDPIAPGTLVVIPPIYRTSGETLAEVAARTGLPERQLRAANPQLGDAQALPEGTVLAVPALYIVPEDTLLSNAAEMLETSSEALLSANPEFAGREEIAAGKVLVVPPSDALDASPTLNQLILPTPPSAQVSEAMHPPPEGRQGE